MKRIWFLHHCEGCDHTFSPERKYDIPITAKPRDGKPVPYPVTGLQDGAV